jgi:hypothetical protein
MVFGKIKTEIASSKLLFQQNFDNESNKSSFWAHCKAIAISLVLLILCSGVVRSLTDADYWAARSLLNDGLLTNGFVENVYVKTEPHWCGINYYVTTIDYRFLGPDGHIYRGTSTIRTQQLQRITAGYGIDVMRDRYRPSTNGWRTALVGKEAEVFGGIFASMLLLPWCSFSLYRYARWSHRRREYFERPHL